MESNIVLRRFSSLTLDGGAESELIGVEMIRKKGRGKE